MSMKEVGFRPRHEQRKCAACPAHFVARSANAKFCLVCRPIQQKLKREAWLKARKAGLGWPVDRQKNGGSQNG